MAHLRRVVPVLVAGLVWAVQLHAQDTTGTIRGQVLDATTQQPLAGANVSISETPYRTVSRVDGTFLLSGAPTGTRRLRVTRIGYGSGLQEVTVTAGATATVTFALQPQAAVLEPVVVTGYGTQRREAITGSVATIDASAANVGVVSNVDNMIQGRAAGVEIIQNSGEPGAGVQIRVRGGTSISASNEPLYVIDGVPIQNVQTEANGYDIGERSAALARNPLNLINPSDIGSITILKDAAAAAIYGSRAANGVVLIETKKGTAGGATMEYDGYVAAAATARYLDVPDGALYRRLVQEQVRAGNLGAATLGPANTDWQREVTRTAVTHNHNLAFTGGSEVTRYRASVNYMNQEGVTRSSGFERIQGRLNATHHALNERLRLGLNVTASHIANDYIPYENTGGFEGGVFNNLVIFNPTRPVTVTDPATGQVRFFELGTGTQGVRNPVALTEQIADLGTSTRALGNASAELDLLPGLTAQVNVGADRSEATRRIYLPIASPVGAEFHGRARQANRANNAVTLQTLLTFRRQLGEIHGLDIVGGYEFSDYYTSDFRAEGQDFVTDALGFNNLDGARVPLPDSSYREDSRLVSFFGRVNYNLRDRYFLTGVLRRDGSSRFGAGNKWATFPAVSASWRISEEDFMRGSSFSDLRLRAGWGLQGNQAVPPYSSLGVLQPTGSTGYPFGDSRLTGVASVRNPNRDLKWEETSQFNVAVDFGLLNNRFSGTVEYYIKTTSDLLLEVPVPQPAVLGTRLENVGKLRNRGLEISLDALAVSRPSVTWRAGLVFAAERNRVINLGPHSSIRNGDVSGQGQSGQLSQRIFPDHPLGTFWGPEFVGWNARGQQMFNDYDPVTRRVIGLTTSPAADDFVVIGDANPDFTLGLTSQVNAGRFDVGFLIRAAVGQDVFSNTALVYAAKSNALTGNNFLAPAMDDPTGIGEPAIFSSRWIDNGSFVRLQNLTVGYRVDLPAFAGSARSARIYVSGDNLLLLTGYDGPDPEVHTEAGVLSQFGTRLRALGTDYLTYPRPRTVTAGIRVAF